MPTVPEVPQFCPVDVGREIRARRARGGRPVHCPRLSNISDLYPPDARGPPVRDTQKCQQASPSVPWEGKFVRI